MKVNRKKVENLREDYRSKSLSKKEVSKSPFIQFDNWFNEAMNADLKEPNAFTLATCTKSGKPSARVILLKGYDKKGFVFYTNYKSRKGKELIANPNAAMVFNWLDLQRQIRIEGKFKQMSAKESDAYFNKRPKESRLGALVSPQSKVIKSRTILEENMEKLIAKYEGTDEVPRPTHWGGFRLTPTVIEFWQGRTSRLHDRIRYKLSKGKWKIDRLAP